MIWSLDIREAEPIGAYRWQIEGRRGVVLGDSAAGIMLRQHGHQGGLDFEFRTSGSTGILAS